MNATVLTPEIATELSDEEKERLALIKQIVDAKRQLYGFGYTWHGEFTSAEAAGKLFDRLYDMDKLALVLINKSYERRINNHINKYK
jgi:hypothetical protein